MTLPPNSPVSTNVVPAPWDIQGRGYLFLFRFPRAWQSRPLFLPDEQRGDFLGGFGALMLVDYQRANCGPYRELLLIPGKFRWRDYQRYAISRIWVSSAASVVSGRANWGIPKQLAEFRITADGKRAETWTVADGDQTIFSAQLRYGRLPLPVHTRVLPFPLLQWLGGRGFLTSFSGSGIGRLATLTDLHVDATKFPDLSGVKPFLGLEISPFSIRFPVAAMVDASPLPQTLPFSAVRGL